MRCGGQKAAWISAARRLRVGRVSPRFFVGVQGGACWCSQVSCVHVEARCRMEQYYPSQRKVDRVGCNGGYVVPRLALSFVRG